MSKPKLPKFSAVVLSHNWVTGETLHQQFEGPGCADKAAGWAYRDTENPKQSSFIWRDFPAADGWIHTVWMSEAARKERGARLADELLSQGTQTERIPR
jgi:hypothetical protein